MTTAFSEVVADTQHSNTAHSDIVDIAAAASEFLLEVLATHDMAQRSLLDPLTSLLRHCTASGLQARRGSGWRRRPTPP